MTWQEINETPNLNLKRRLVRLIAPFPLIEESEESWELALEYVQQRVIPERFLTDARHIAVASLAKMDYLVSWNFEHLVNVHTRSQVEAINQRRGLKGVQIVSPLELGGGQYV